MEVVIVVRKVQYCIIMYNSILKMVQPTRKYERELTPCCNYVDPWEQEITEGRRKVEAHMHFFLQTKESMNQNL